jgi:DNA-directed RNA polymerase specialized sigma subunit
MKTTYLVWKDPACNGINPEWEQISRSGFLALVKSPEGKGRRFVRLASTNGDGSDDRIVIEATEKEFKAWLKEKRHAQHLRDSDPGYTLISYHTMEGGDEDCNGEEVLRDEDSDVETECFARFDREAVRSALAMLSDDERQMMEYFYLSAVQGTERGYSALTGISKTSVNRRKMALLQKLKNFLSDLAGQNGF